jgi:hypothetical protein
MEMDRFDALTRTLSTADASRRQALRALGSLLLSGTLGGVAARLGLAEDAVARPKKRHKAKAKRHHKPQAERKGRERLQAAGKHHKKHKNKHHDKPKDPPPLPPGCQHCNECQMCQDGACVPDPDLGGVPCLESGATCSYCQSGTCTATDIPPCEDGLCARRGYCCPGEKYCPDHESPLGYACVGESDCCPGQKKCADGTCILRSGCCEQDKPQCDRACNFIQCVGGEWECHPRPFGDYCLMPYYEPGICCKGECRPRDSCERDGGHYDPDTCICIK